MKWFVKCIKNYVNFSGRARRAEYWYFVLFAIIFSIAARLIDLLIFDSDKVQLISSLFSLFIFLPQTAVMVRRLHDIGRSGKILLWYYIIAVIWVIALVVSGFSTFVAIMNGSLTAAPAGFLALLIGGGLVFFVWGIVFLVWCCTPGQTGDNQYGPDPKTQVE